MSVDMQFSTRHDKEDMAQPITHVLKYEEKRIEQPRKHPLSCGNIRVEQSFSGGVIKPIIQRANMYWNTSQFLKDFHKELLWRRNMKKTLQQPVQVMVPHGVTQTDMSSRAVIAMIQVLHQQNQQVSKVEAAKATTAFSRHISDQTGKGNGDAIVALPADILGTSNQPRIMQLVQQHQHLQMTASSNLQTPASSKKTKKEDALPPMRRRKARKPPQTECAHSIF
jgi:hypothetical protein